MENRKQSWLMIFLSFLAGLIPAGKYVAYLGYFCLGTVLCRSTLSSKNVRRLIVLAVVAYGGALLLGIGLQQPQWLLREQMPHVWLCSAALFVCLATKQAFCPKLVGKIAPCQMGIYLLHPAINFSLRMIGLHALTIDPLLGIPVCVLLVAWISYLAVRLMKKIPLMGFFV